ncbi:MAG: helix-turn-helix domain-containing protein [Clostridia bacterium]|nr:helix-turn-helix domain-containing protein [Clostridia bacterium]
MKSFKEIQKTLRSAIKTSSLQQKEIAQRLNVHPTTINKYMHRDTLPALDTFANLCEILDVSADDILGLRK